VCRGGGRRCPLWCQTLVLNSNRGGRERAYGGGGGDEEVNCVERERHRSDVTYKMMYNWCGRDGLLRQW
jgi:hypothetical protein